MGSRLTVLQKGLILIAIPLAFQLALMALLIGAQREQSEAAHGAYRTSAEIAQFYRVLTTLIETQNALRGFVLLGTPALDAAFQEAKERAGREIDRLQKLVAHDSENARRVERITEHASDLIGWLAATAAASRRGERDAAVKRIAVRTVEPVARELDEFLARALREERARQEAIVRADRWIVSLVGVGTVVVVAVMGLLALIFSRDLALRLSLVAENTRRLAAGQALTDPLSGEDEIAHVDRSFREMSKALQAAAIREREQRAQLERSALELAAVNRDLRHRNEENELFVYSVSHDMRSPLVNLQGFSRELRRACEELGAAAEDESVPADVGQRMRTLLERDVAEAIHFITTAVSRLGTIIDALLHLSRVGRIEYRPQAVDVRAVVAKIHDSLQSTLAERRITVAVAPLPPCWGDAAAIEQVFANLLDNAIKYLDPARPGLIEIGSGGKPGQEPDTMSLLQTYYVKDNGVGIAEVDQAKIFLAFQRAHSSTEGEGIGLAIVRRIVERHGGQVRVESTVGEGSAFFVSFPVSPAAISG